MGHIGHFVLAKIPFHREIVNIIFLFLGSNPAGNQTG